MGSFHKSNWMRSASFFLLIAAIIAIPAKKPEQTKADTEGAAIAAPVAPVKSADLEITPAPAPDAPPTVNITTAAAPAPAFAGQISGFSLYIPAIGVNSRLGYTGLDAAGHLAVPSNGNTAAWYKLGPQPGNAGTALITGHLNWSAGDGIFINLNKLRAGDEIRVRRQDGKIATFRVDQLASYSQDSTFPWNLVYRTGGSSALRIITCDGVYSSKLGHYTRNLVVYASLVSMD